MSAAGGLLTLRKRALRAGGWSFAGYGLSYALRLGSNLLMTRLLAPEMFGVMAIATTVTVVLNLLTDLGVNQNIVQSRRGDDPLFLDTAWVVQILRGAALWMLALGLCGALNVAGAAGLFPAGSVYAWPLLPLVIAVSSFAAVIQGFQSTRMATAQRRFDQKRLIQIELAGQAIGLAVMIPCALASRSVWALVAGVLVAAAAQTLLSHLWTSGHANRFRWERDSLRELLGFGKWVFVSSAFYVIAVNGDRLLLGGLVGADVLGVYAIALLIVASLEGVLSRMFLAVSLPAFSEIARKEPSRMREVYYRMRVPGDLLLLFSCGALAAAGPLVIGLLYDARYADAGRYIQVLALSLIAARYGVAHQVYLALGLTRHLAAINVVRCAALFVSVPVLFWVAGLHGALWAIALHALATLPLVFRFNARLGLNDWRRELQVLAALPAGYLCGWAASLSLAQLR